MTFLNPLVLLGLVAAAVPLILHLLNLRKLRTIEFSSLRFLKQLQRTQMRRLRIRQILLLILRTLLVVAIVMAFSRPALHGSLAGMIGGRTSTTMTVIIDDSPSMEVRNEGGMLFTQAKEAASRIITLANDGDAIFLLPLSAVRAGESPLSFASPVPARAALDRLQLSNVFVPFADAIGPVRSAMTSTRNANLEVYVVSDMQSTLFAKTPGDSAASFDARTSLFFLPIASGQHENAAVTGVDITTRIITVNKPVDVQAVILNAGESTLHNTIASIYLDGERVAQQLLDLQPQSAENAIFRVIPKRRGFVAGYVQLEEDPLEADNKRYFVVDVPKSINILVMGATKADIRFPSLALTLAGDSAVAGLFRVDQQTLDRLSLLDLNPYDVIVLSGPQSFSAQEAEIITRFVTAGGGLVLFPGRDLNVQSYNETLFRRLGIPPASRSSTGGARDTVRNQAIESGFLSYGRVDFAHPLFSGLFDRPPGRSTALPVIESPRIHTTLFMQGTAQTHTVISLSNGSPFLLETAAGEGRALLFAVEAGVSWSDFPVKSVFAPLLHRAMVYLSAAHQAAPAAIVGDRILIATRIRQPDAHDSYGFVSPSGSVERVVPSVLSPSGTARFESAPTSETGVYRLMRFRLSGAGRKSATGEELEAIAVNLSPLESELRPADATERGTFLAKTGIDSARVRILPVGGSIERTIQESRFGVELWKYLLGVALALAIAEIAVGRISRVDAGVQEQ